MTIPNRLMEYLNQQLSDKCVKLKKSIYGQVQAARAWWKQSTNSLQKIGFKKYPSDNCLMMRINKAVITLLCICVDNVCVFGNQKAVEAIIKQVESIYSIKRVGPLTENLQASTSRFKMMTYILDKWPQGKDWEISFTKIFPR